MRSRWHLRFFLLLLLLLDGVVQWLLVSVAPDRNSSRSVGWHTSGLTRRIVRELCYGQWECWIVVRGVRTNGTLHVSRKNSSRVVRTDNDDAFGTDTNRGSAFQTKNWLLHRLYRWRRQPAQSPTLAHTLFGEFRAPVAVERHRQPIEWLAKVHLAIAPEEPFAEGAHHGARHTGSHVS